MRRCTTVARSAAGLVAGAALVLVGACDSGGGSPSWGDAATDSGVDITLDMGDTAGDPGTDPGVDTAVDPGTDDAGGTCTYPAGTYAFSTVGDLVAPMSWPAAGIAATETHPADLEALFCDPEVKSIFIMVASTS